MEKNSRIYVAGHRGLVGSAIVRNLKANGFTNIVTRTHAELDLTNQADVRKFFEEERPEYVFLAALVGNSFVIMLTTFSAQSSSMEQL